MAGASGRNSDTAFLPAAPAAPGPDAELVACCHAFAQEALRQAELWRVAVTVEVEETIEMQIAGTAAAHAAALDHLCALQARTMAGVRAKVAVLAAVEPAFLRGELEGSEVGGRILASLMRDVLALPPDSE